MTGRRHPLGAALALALALAGLTGACGLRSQDDPVAMDDVALPADRPPAEAQGDTPDLEQSTVYLVSAGHLQLVHRPRQPTLTATLEALLEGPRDTEVAFGLRSAIPAGTQLLGVSADEDAVTVDLSEEFTSIVGAESLLAIAQLVYTATEATGLDRVNIAIEGQAVPVAREDGALTAGAVTRADYSSLAPP